MPLFYAHGLPGSAAELDFAWPSGVKRPIVLPPDGLASFDKAMVQASTKPAALIGFSLGAFNVLQIAAARPDLVSALHLVSPAAPLELGDFLPKMAGRPVFDSARSKSWLFDTLTIVQGLIADLAPGQLIRAMFHGSAEVERKLLDDPAFVAALRDGLRASLCRDTRAYRTAVRRYVQPWAHALPRVMCPVSIWHGSADTWAPPEMSRALAAALGARAVLTEWPNEGHYSTLRRALSQIAA